MRLVRITELTKQLGLSSRTLRYYEQAGLIASVRPQFETLRYYDDAAVQRLRQIIILRKMQIPVKDIVRIYENPEMTTVVEVFADKLREIDRDVTALSELKRIIDAFLQKMITGGIKKITALPLLYEEMEKQFKLRGETQPVTVAALESVQERLAKPVEAAIVSLPAMRVLTSIPKRDPQTSDAAGFGRYLQLQGIGDGRPGQHERFEYQTESGDAVMVRIAEDFCNDSDWQDRHFDGGLFAAVNVYVDEDPGARFRALIESFDSNPFYEIAYLPDGELRHPALAETLISPDERRELVCLYVPVRKRLENPGLYEKAVEVPPERITIAEIEAQNPALWAVDVPLSSITPINRPHYRVLENGEAEYTGWISTRVLDTNVAVRLPFRVDMEFRLAGDDEKYGFGADEGCMILYHGADRSYHAGGHAGLAGFGVNMGNAAAGEASADVMRREAISFRQPIFHDLYHFPGRGKIDPVGPNHVTWIVGEKHLAVIINGELRYCGVNFPYMARDLSGSEAHSIVIGSDGQGMKYIKSIRVSQLACEPKVKLKKEELRVITRKSNNRIADIHRLVTEEHGENYWFNGCARYVMECFGEREFDYSFFAGLTGDVFTQVYPRGDFRGTGVSGYMLLEGAGMVLREREACFELAQGETCFAEQVFETCGYAATFVTNRELRHNTELYLQTLTASIDRGIPVISWGYGDAPYGVFVGYEEYGRTLLFITGNSDTPRRVSIEEALEAEIPELTEKSGWIFVGGKKAEVSLKALYRRAIFALPKLMMTESEHFVFGAAAFRAWADEIASGKFEQMKPEAFDPWGYHTAYVCSLATNASCCHAFLEKARQLNPELTFLEDVSRLYKRCGAMWNRDDGRDLEAIGGGFNVTLEALQDREKRDRIAAKLREFADVTDEIVRVLAEGKARCGNA